MTTLIEIPLDGGIQEGVDSKLLPDGVLRVVENCFLRRDGQLEVRPGDTALGMTTFNNQTLVAFDCLNFDERLLAAGSDQTAGFPEDYFEFVDSTQDWKGLTILTNSPRRIPWASQVRDLGTAPDGDGDVVRCTAAAHNGLVVMAYFTFGETFSRAHVFKSDTDSTVIYQPLSSAARNNPKAIVTTTGIFWIVGATTGSISGHRYDPASDETINTSATSLDAGVGLNSFDCAPVTGGGGGFVTVTSRTASVIIKHFNDAGALQITITGPAATSDSVGIQADSADNRVSIIYHNGVAAASFRLATYNLTTGALVQGPTTLFGGNTGPADAPCAITKYPLAANELALAAYTTSVTPQTQFENRDQNAHATITYTHDWLDAMLASDILNVTGDNVFQYQLPDGPSSNYLASDFDGTQLVAKDFETGFTPTTPGGQRSTISRDAVTGKYYWSNLFENNDGSASGQVTELELKSDERRQVAQLAGLLYTAGGMPTVFDGRMNVEQGFTERPRFTTAPVASNGAGSLASLGTYSYQVTWLWTDAQRNIHRSPPSAISEITLGASDDTVTVEVSSPHSLRCNDTAKAVYGSCVRVELWRTACTVTSVAASLTTAPVTPPSTPLNGLTFAVAVDGGGFQAFIFGAGDNTATNIAGSINANTTGLTATVDGAQVIITSDTTGTTSSLRFGGTVAALSALGIVLGQTVTGSRTVTRGQNFHRTATAVVGTATAFGARISITDLTSDDDLRENEVIYTQSQTPIAHHAPQPHDYVWNTGDSLLVAGQPRRSEWTRSKRLFFAEPIEFADPGRLAFNGRGNGDLTAAVAIDQSNLLFTRSDLQTVQGTGPDHSGVGEFFSPDDVPVDGGVADWRSLIITTDGLFLALDATPSPKLYLTRGGEATWISFPVQDLLDAFPVIVGAAHIRAQQHVAFACNNVAGNAATILRYDLRRKVWYSHTVGTALRGVSNYQGRLAYVTSAGVVVLADAAPGSGTFVPYRIRTGSFTGFASLGYGSIHKVGFLGEIRGNCSLEALIAYDEVTFTTLDAFSLTGSAGTVVKKLWTPPRDRVDAFVLEFRVTGTSDSAGVRLNKLLLEVEKAPGVTRRGPADLK